MPAPVYVFAFVCASMCWCMRVFLDKCRLEDTVGDYLPSGQLGAGATGAADGSRGEGQMVEVAQTLTAGDASVAESGTRCMVSQLFSVVYVFPFN